MTIFLLPGMGATAEMYPDPWRKLPNVHPLEWPQDFQGTTLTNLANHLIKKHEISSSDVVIGSSLGGMVAAEISNLIGLRHCILIGSAIHPTEIPSLYRRIYPLIDFIPLKLSQKIANRTPLLTARMFAQSSPDFICLTTHAIFKWRGLQSSENLFRIHGSRDLMIPHPEHTHLTLTGGHLIATTHAEECCIAIEKIL